MTSRRTTLIALLAVCFAVPCMPLRAADAPQPESLSDALSDRIVSVSQGWGALGLNVSVAAEGQKPVKLRVKDKEFAQGLGHHADGEIVVDLGGEFKSFQTEVGVQWQGGSAPASVVLQIFADDKKVFDSGVIRENDPPRPVTVSVDGAKELRLVASDAGDGIHSDCVVWADARLLRNPAAPARPLIAVNIAPFARVASWDPKVMTGTKATRVQEYPAADVAPYTELLPSPDGRYVVPVTAGQACIGLEWLENRLLRRVELEFPGNAVPAPDSVQLQYWTGASAWQGGWQRADVAPKKIGNTIVWSFGFQQIPRGTPKVRWVFADVKQPIAIANISAFSRSRCDTIDVRIESTRPDSSAKAEIDVHNGVFSPGSAGVPPAAKDAGETPALRCTWDTSKPLTLKILYCVPQRYKVDRTVLRFQMPGAAFGVAIEDLLANDCVYVPHAGVFVTRLPAPTTLADYQKKIAGKKSVLEEVREQPDQDFARAWQAVHNPTQDLGPMMISLANDNRKYIALRDGGILFDQYDRPDDSRAAFPGTIYEINFSLPWRCMPTFGSNRDLKVARNLLADWLPIPVTTVTDGNVVYSQISFVVPMSEAAPAGSPSWLRDRAMCVADYHARNGGTEAAPVRLALGIANDKKTPITLQDVKEGVLVVAGDRVVALIVIDDAALLTVKREGNGVVLSGNLPTQATAHCYVCLPAWKIAPKNYAFLMEGKGLLSRAASYWRTLLEPAMQIDTPDALLNNIIRASQVHCMMAARCGDRGEQIAAWTAATVYGPLESESNSIIRGMDMNGQTDFARRSLDFFLKLRNKQGFITTGYTIVGTGEVLWTLGEHYDRTRDRAWMKKIAPGVVQVCQWIIRQREKTKRIDAAGRKVPEYGLMTPGISADWDRYAYRLFNDAQFYAGLEAGGRILADIGDPAAPAIQEDAKKYREDIARAYHWMQARTPVVKLQNGTWAPADPVFMNCLGRVEEFLPSEDVDRTWGYSVDLGAHHLAAAGAIDPASRDVDWTADNFEDVQCLRSGWGDYPEDANRKDVFSLGGFAKLQPYYCRIAEVHALRDDVKPFIRSYFNCIPTLVSRENLSFWEHLHNRGAWNKTHETGWFLCQSRIMFVAERGDELWLAPFATNHWMKDGMKLSVRNAPTRFGTVGYTIASHVAKGEIEAVVQLPKDFTAKKIVLRLRHPDGKPIRSISVRGTSNARFDPQMETIALTRTDESTTIRVRAKY